MTPQDQIEGSFPANPPSCPDGWKQVLRFQGISSDPSHADCRACAGYLYATRFLWSP